MRQMCSITYPINPTNILRKYFLEAFADLENDIWICGQRSTNWLKFMKVLCFDKEGRYMNI